MTTFTSGCHFLKMGFVICYAVKPHADLVSNSCLEMITMTNCNSYRGRCQNPSGPFALKLSVPNTNFVPRKKTFWVHVEGIRRETDSV